MAVSHVEGIGDVYTISEVSEMTGVSVATLRNWYRLGPENGGTKAPSLERIQGDKVTYLYTTDDLEEIKNRKGKRVTRNRRNRNAVRRQDN